YETEIAAAGLEQIITPTSVFQATADMPEDIHSGILKHISKVSSDGLIESVQSLTLKLTSIMPEMPVGEHLSTAQMIMGLSNQDMTFQFIKLTFFSLFNNSLDPRVDVSEKIIGWLQNEEIPNS